MVEGSEIDWAAHANDPVGIVGDILAFDRAVEVALDFAKKDNNTVVIIASDHGTGGLTIGNRDSNGGYDTKPLDAFVQNLRNAKMTAEGIEKLINPDMPLGEIRRIIAGHYGISDLTGDENARILNFLQKVKNKDRKEPQGLNCILGPMMARRCSLGFTGNGHTGEDVVLYEYSPNDRRLTGVVENTDIAFHIEKILGLNLKSTTDKLFINARKTLEGKGVTLVEGENGFKNPALFVSGPGRSAVIFPSNKDYATDIEGRVIKKFKNGVNVLYDGQWFLPEEGINLLSSSCLQTLIS